MEKSPRVAISGVLGSGWGWVTGFFVMLPEITGWQLPMHARTFRQ